MVCMYYRLFFFLISSERQLGSFQFGEIMKRLIYTLTCMILCEHTFLFLLGKIFLKASVFKINGQMINWIDIRKKNKTNFPFTTHKD